MQFGIGFACAYLESNRECRDIPAELHSSSRYNNRSILQLIFTPKRREVEMNELLQPQPVRERIPSIIIFACCAACCLLQILLTTPRSAPTSLLLVMVGTACVIAFFSTTITAIWITATTALCIIIYPAVPLTLAGFACIAICMASRCSIKLGIVLAGVLSAGALLNAGMFPYTDAMFGSGLCLLAICASIVAVLLGCVSRARKQATEHNQSDGTRSQPTQSNLSEHAIARQLHDHTANDLSNIVMLTERAQSGEGDSAAILDTIHRLSNDALQQTRESIASLEMGAETNYVQRLRAVIAQQQEQLTQLGLHGDIIDTYHPQSLSNEDFVLLNALLHELLGNLAKYADKSHPYLFLFTLEDGMCTIESLNYVRTEQTPSSRIGGLHTGLAHYESIVNKLGGDWNVQESDGRWMIKISVPLSHQQSQTIAGSTNEHNE